MLAFIYSSFEAFIRKAYLRLTLEIMKAVFLLRLGFLRFLSDRALKKRKAKLVFMNYINQKLKMECFLRVFPSRISLLSRIDHHLTLL